MTEIRTAEVIIETSCLLVTCLHFSGPESAGRGTNSFQVGKGEEGVCLPAAALFSDHW